MKTLLWIATWSVVACSVVQGATKEKESTPEEVYKEFRLAILDGDRDQTAKISLPAKELDVLFEEERLPEDIDQQKEAISTDTYRVLKVGEVFTFPNGRTLTIEPKSVELGWVMIVGKTDPFPHMLRKVEGKFLVDAGDLIAIRKARKSRTNR